MNVEIEKYLQKDFKYILQLDEKNYDKVFASQINNTVFKENITNKQVSPFLFDTTLLKMLEDWVEDTRGLKDDDKQEAFEEIEELLFLNYAI